MQRHEPTEAGTLRQEMRPKLPAAKARKSRRSGVPKNGEKTGSRPDRHPQEGRNDLDGTCLGEGPASSEGLGLILEMCMIVNWGSLDLS